MVTLVNRAKVATATTGTGAITLGAAEDGYQTFPDAGLTGSETVRYTIEDGDAWEIGTGGINATVTTMSRTLIESSTGSKLNLSGNAVVYVTAAGQDIQQPPFEGAFENGDKTKLDGIEAGADVTDTANVTAAGALMDSEVTNLAQVKAFDSADYATAAQGTTADSAVQPNDSPSFGSITVTGTVDGRDVAADGTKLDGIEAGANVTDTANVTAAGALMDSEVTNLAQVKAFDSADYATAAQGTLADSATQPGDNVSTLTNDAGYTTNVGDITGVTAGSGISGGGTSGTVTVNHADTSTQSSINNSGATFIQDVTVDTYGHVTGLGSSTITPATIGAATSAQGSLADSATQPGDNVSTLTNDAGYTTNVGDITNVSAGTGLSGGGASGSVTLNVDLSELTDMTAAMISTDEFIVLDAGADRRKAAGEIGLSIFSNDAGFTTNVGDITGVTAGTDLTGGGSSGTVTINHADTSTLSGTYGSTADGTKIDQITVDARGHVTAITTGATGDIQGVTAGSGISGGGTSGTVTVSHADTSSQGSVNNSGATVIQDVTLDTYGHVTGLGSKTLSASDVGALSTSGKAADSELLDGINSTSFLRSDASDTFTTLSGTQLNLGSQVQLRESTDRADLLQITSSTSGWAGLQIRNSSDEGRWSFMTDGATAGFYDDENNDWAIQMLENSEVRLYHNASEKLNTLSSGVFVTGNITLSGTVDGRDVATDGAKLDGIAAGATANVGDITAVTAGTDLTGGGTSGSVTINHADTSTLSGTYGSTANGTKIDQITVDARGHVTAITTGTTGDILGVTAGSGLSGGGTSGTPTLSHADTSSQGSVNNSGTTVIQDVTLDTYGHVTGLSSTTINAGGKIFRPVGSGYMANTTYQTFTGLTGLESFLVTGYMDVSNNSRELQVSYYNGSTWTSAVNAIDDMDDGYMVFGGNTSTIYSANRNHSLKSIALSMPSGCQGVRFRASGSLTNYRYVIFAAYD